MRLSRLPAALLAFCLASAGGAVQAQEVVDTPRTLNDRERVAHLLSRLAYGARPGEIDRVVEMGIDAWLDDQLGQKDAQDPRLADRLSEFQTLHLDIAGCAAYISTPASEQKTEAGRRAARRKQQIPRNELMEAVALRAAFSDRQATEVMADFWRNHFNVSFTKGRNIYAQVPDYERTVIQDNVWGDFPTMLTASATHPAMLNYLDNYLSRRPPSKQELKELERKTKRRTGSEDRAEEAVALASQRGLNENYARELLELHTLGVDNYYKQKDVIAVAECLTGWTIQSGRDSTREFLFNGGMHVEGDKKVLGKRMKEDKAGGPGQGMAVIELLGKHEGTAEFLAMKMVRYLVADVPPKRLVGEVTKVYQKTGGDLTAMVRTIVESEEFWDPSNVRSKFKTPYEYVVSAIRVTGCEVGSLGSLERYMQAMGQPLYHCDDPTGYYDTADAWLDPGVMALRWEFAVDLANGKVQGVLIPDTFYDQVPADVPPRLWQHYLTELILPGGAGERTRAALATVTSEYLDKKRVPDLFELGPQLVGLLLGSPEFQQQ